MLNKLVYYFLNRVSLYYIAIFMDVGLATERKKVKFLQINLYFIWISIFVRIVKELVSSGKKSHIKKVLKILGDEFALSSNPNARNGGFIGLAASAIALGKVCY